MSAWITTLDPVEFWITISVLFGGSIYLLFKAFSSLQKKRVIKDTPTSWLRSAAQGYTELVGRGLPIDGPVLRSPLSGRECLWYRIKTEKIGQKMGGRESQLGMLLSLLKNRTGRVRRSEESDDLFYLDDDTGRCVIDPEGAQITPSLTRSWYGNAAVPDRGPALGGSPIGYRYKYTEELLLPGDILYAIGDLHTVGGAGSLIDRKHEVREILREWKQDQNELLARFDRNRDGELSPWEWQQAQRAAHKEVDKKLTHNDAPPVVTLLKDTGDPRRPFMISSDPLHDLIEHYHNQSLAYLTASIFSVGLIGWLLDIHF